MKNRPKNLLPVLILVGSFLDFPSQLLPLPPANEVIGLILLMVGGLNVQTEPIQEMVFMK